MPAIDAYANAPDSLQAPARDATPVTPSDGADLVNVTKALVIGGAGNISVITAAGNTVLISGLTAGAILNLRVSRVRATGTTATNIVALQ